MTVCIVSRTCGKDSSTALRHPSQFATIVSKLRPDSSRSVLSLTWGTRLTSAFCTSVLFFSIEWLEMKLVS
jgi:hypothetical protein